MAPQSCGGVLEQYLKTKKINKLGTNHHHKAMDIFLVIVAINLFDF
jgi:hypothetical protein